MALQKTKQFPSKNTSASYWRVGFQAADVSNPARTFGRIVVQGFIDEDHRLTPDAQPVDSVSFPLNHEQLTAIFSAPPAEGMPHVYGVVATACYAYIKGIMEPNPDYDPEQPESEENPQEIPGWFADAVDV